MLRPLRAARLAASPARRYAPPVIGEKLSGRFRIERLLGRGGMSSVWEAYDEELGRPVAVKLLHARRLESADAVDRFEREARTLALLAHPGIVTVIDRGENDGRPFIVCELVDGRDLHERIALAGPPPASREALAIAVQVAAALAYAHARGVIHRDVKPHNVLLTEDGHAKLTDFGIARVLDAPALTDPGRVLGTGDYVAPEQAQGRPLDGRADIYALGVMLYHCLTGVPPYRGASFVELAEQHLRAPGADVAVRCPDLPDRLAAILRARWPRTRTTATRAASRCSWTSRSTCRPRPRTPRRHRRDPGRGPRPGDGRADADRAGAVRRAALPAAPGEVAPTRSPPPHAGCGRSHSPAGALLPGSARPSLSAAAWVAGRRTRRPGAGGPTRTSSHRHDGCHRSGDRRDLTTRATTRRGRRRRRRAPGRDCERDRRRRHHPLANRHVSRHARVRRLQARRRPDPRGPVAGLGGELHLQAGLRGWTARVYTAPGETPPTGLEGWTPVSAPFVLAHRAHGHPAQRRSRAGCT